MEVSATVVAFDAAVGIGTARLDDGRELGFHATQLMDGTRRIAAGARVTARVVPGHRGAYELHGLVAR